VGICDDGEKAGGAYAGVAGEADGDDIRGVGCWKHRRRETSLREYFATRSRTGRRRKPGAGGCKHTVDVCDEETLSILSNRNTLRGKKPREWPVGQLERRTEAISGEFNSQKRHFENISEHVRKKKILFLRLCYP
jgi:hypothetical protein